MTRRLCIRFLTHFELSFRFKFVSTRAKGPKVPHFTAFCCSCRHAALRGSSTRVLLLLLLLLPPPPPQSAPVTPLLPGCGSF
jgi:hypothetical protein